MAPKKASTTTKKAGASAAHPSYADMITEGIISLKDKGGSSRQSLKKYVQANHNLGNTTEAAFTSNFNKALQKGSENGTFVRPKGPSGPVKLGVGSKSGDSKPAAAKKTATKAKTAATTTKKAPAKKAATKTGTKKAPASKSKSTANTSKKVRKTAPAAPAVDDKPAVSMGKTKSGRVTKSKAPGPVRKTVAPKKSASKTAAAPKKAAAKA